MRIVVHDYAGHPFQVQLSRSLAARGHEVLHLHCSSYLTGKGSLERTPHDPPGFEVEAIDLGEPFRKYGIAKRVVQERRYGRLCAERVVAYRPDVVVSSNTPLFAQQVLMPRVRATGAPFVFWQQDVYSMGMRAAVRRVLPFLESPIGALFEQMEGRMLRRSDQVVVISEDFLPILGRWGVTGDDVTVIENWAPLDELPMAAHDNPWAREHGVADGSVVLYSGTLGLKHNPSLLLELARHLERRGDGRLVVISEGLGADWLRDQVRQEPVSSLRQLPFQPFDAMPEVLASADVLVAILEPEAGVFSVPSKILTYHCAGRAILAAMPGDNLGARIIRREGSGTTVEPGDVASLLGAVDELLDDTEATNEIGTRGRRYAEAAFDIEAITGRFEQVLRRACENSVPQTR